MSEIIDYGRSARSKAKHVGDRLIEKVGGRRTTALNGTWQAVVDPYARGELLGMAPRAQEPGSPSDLGEFSFENGMTLEVPGDWNTQDPRLVFYQGVVWYKRLFDFQPTAGERTYLYFGAANYVASVYLNGELVGVHEGGFTPFNFDVSERLHAGENLLVVKVDNRHQPDDVPTPTTDWLNYGGLTRDVLLVHVADTFARRTRIGLDASGRIAGFVEFDGTAPPGDVRVAVPELGVDARVAVEAGRAVFGFEAEPERWTPKAPRLYRFEVGDADSALSDDVGFRTVATRGHEILLNGEPVFLRGISIHDEAIDGGRVRSRAEAEAVLALARELGCNFVRLAHYTHHEEMVRAADRLGLLVWGEIPVYWAVEFDNPLSLARAQRQLTAMIARDANRASVALWSIANETPQSPERMAFLRALADHVRSEDPSRLVTAALVSGAESLTPFVLRSYLPALALGIRRAEWTFPVNDELAEVVDVVAVNEYFGWYYSGALAALTPFSSAHTRRVMLDNMDRIVIDAGVDKPLVVSEMGAGARRGLRAPADDLVVYSEDYQALVYRRQLAMLDRQPSLAGLSPWILKDFRSPLRLHQGYQDYWNRKGLVDETGAPKEAFGVLQRYYRARAEG